jgi:hypothetical protein
MAEAAKTATTTEAPAKRKRAPFTRTVKPVYAVVRYKNEDGTYAKLSKANLEITVEKDMDKIVEMVQEGDGNFVLAKIDLAPAKPAAPAAE